MDRKLTFQLQKRKKCFWGRAVRVEKQWWKSSRGDIFDREIIIHGGASVIVPVLPNDYFVLVNQHRAAVNDYILEFPAGTLEKGEHPRKCAQRELQEEVGYRAGKLKKLVQIYPAPGISTEKMHIFLATQLSTTASQQLDPDEFLHKEIVKGKELERKIRKGQIQDAKTIIGYYYYRMNQ